MTDFKRPLIALLSQIDHDITQYLQKAKYYEVDNLEKLGELKYRYKHHAIIHQETQNQWLFVVSDGIRNTKLTAGRLASLLDVKRFLKNENNTANSCTNVAELQNRITRIEYTLQEAMRVNARLDMDFEKQHMTYTQNRLRGLSVFSSWSQKSSHQSRAMQQLEKAMNHVEAFVKAHGLEDNSPRFQPNRS